MADLKCMSRGMPGDLCDLQLFTCSEGEGPRALETHDVLPY